MRILYGVTGEGMGHAIRSRVILQELLKEHQIEVVSSGRAQKFLAENFREVHKIHGLHIVYRENRVQKTQTFLQNFRDGLQALPTQIASYFRLIEDFSPEVVISDFESWSYLFGKLHQIPIISIDNMQIINRCAHSKEILAGEKASFRLAKAIIKAKLPGCFHYLITSFFYPKIRKKRTTLVPPILREEILQKKSQVSQGEHLLVYQTSEDHQELIDALKALPCESRVYGIRRDITTEVREENISYRPFSESGFINDLASARGVVAGGGFTLMGEAVFLQKPMLSIPIQGQFEQSLNARYLAQLGYGASGEKADFSTLQRFFDALETYQKNLDEYSQENNQTFFSRLYELLDQIEAGLA